MGDQDFPQDHNRRPEGAEVKAKSNDRLPITVVIPA